MIVQWDGFLGETKTGREVKHGCPMGWVGELGVERLGVKHGNTGKHNMDGRIQAEAATIFHCSTVYVKLLLRLANKYSSSFKYELKEPCRLVL